MDNGKIAKDLDAVAILLDECRGTYIPKNFVEGFHLDMWGLDENDEDVLACQDPDSEWYWEAWTSIMEKAKFDNGDGTFHILYQDGSLFALNVDKMTREEKENFGYEVEQGEFCVGDSVTVEGKDWTNPSCVVERVTGVDVTVRHMDTDELLTVNSVELTLMGDDE